MIRLTALLIFSLALSIFVSHTSIIYTADVSSSSAQWKITSVKVCRTPSGALDSDIEVLGSYPVYSFFVPRPVWTVNGSVADAKPVYQQGRLVSFQLLGAGLSLKSGTKNTVKFSLPDQNGSRTFQYDEKRPTAGECWEFF
ncbi:MAG: hypothetical protein HY913_09975 [Desulfomonile tiedjei]|nr:hypothetical protein [Desulfomonile tiedjei]